jgi:hypothetical protein
MEITVYHHLLANDASIEKPIIYPVAYFAELEGNAVSKAFELTNSIDEAWVSAASEKALVMLRSTSKGDVVKIGRGRNAEWLKFDGWGMSIADPKDYIITTTMTDEGASAAREIPGRRAGIEF